MPRSLSWVWNLDSDSDLPSNRGQLVTTKLACLSLEAVKCAVVTHLPFTLLLVESECRKILLLTCFLSIECSWVFSEKHSQMLQVPKLFVVFIYVCI